LTQENDVVLIHFEDKPLMFARIEEILPDAKPDWYHVKLLMLQIPLQVVTWILRDAYIDGDEFTMSGHKMRLEKVICPEFSDDVPEEDIHDRKEDTIVSEATQPAPVMEQDTDDDDSPDDTPEGAEVISFTDRFKK
jgi:hypothetical protein